MSFFDDLNAVSEVKKIKAGGVGKLSISQVANLIVNLPDAKRNLDQRQYKEIQDAFNKFRKCKTKYPMDAQEYVSCCKKIILMLDEIAPYEKYCGGNEIEFSFMMQDFRASEENKKDIKGHIQEFLETIVDKYGSQTDAENYIQYIIDGANDRAAIELTYDKAKMFQGILIVNQLHGADIALLYFEWLVQYWIMHDTSSLEKIENLRDVVSFLSGVLVANKLVDSKGCDVIRNKYCDILNQLENKRLSAERNQGI